ncbi:MAG: calcium/sodium antiporter [Oscillospiraceae bacterium]|jgi:cation:H+ antiporter|nr:calcium/sodium antiporter [Oscillospiraceae bacterium]
MGILVNILLILAGFVLLIKGADVLVSGASGVAKRLKMSDIMIGLTIVAFGTSMPELFVSVTSALQNKADLAIGNVVGSNLFNLLVVIGLTAVIKPIIVGKQTKRFDLPLSLVYMVAFAVLCNLGGELIGLPKSVVLLVMFAVFVAYSIFMGKKFPDNPDIPADSLPQNGGAASEGFENPVKQRHIGINILFIVVGIAALKFGGDFVVENSVEIATTFGIPERIIGLTIVALGTSLPELVTSVVACIKNESDIAIGNILGSNIFNMFLIIGIGGAINPIKYSPDQYNIGVGIVIGATALLTIFAALSKKNRINRVHGAVFLLMYAGYMVYTLV